MSAPPAPTACPGVSSSSIPESAMTDAVVAAPVAGRSLTRLALDRLMRNRAAVVSAFVLFAIAALYIFGPYVTPHAYDQVFESYVRTAPSTEPYPRANT